MPLTTSEKADRFGSAPRRLPNVKNPQETDEILGGYVRRSGIPTQQEERGDTRRSRDVIG